jgi:hypothetical protein
MRVVVRVDQRCLAGFTFVRGGQKEKGGHAAF